MLQDTLRNLSSLNVSNVTYIFQLQAGTHTILSDLRLSFQKQSAVSIVLTGGQNANSTIITTAGERKPSVLWFQSLTLLSLHNITITNLVFSLTDLEGTKIMNVQVNGNVRELGDYHLICCSSL
jgi:hypothetical protein